MLWLRLGEWLDEVHDVAVDDRTPSGPIGPPPGWLVVAVGLLAGFLLAAAVGGWQALVVGGPLLLGLLAVWHRVKAGRWPFGPHKLDG